MLTETRLSSASRRARSSAWLTRLLTVLPLAILLALALVALLPSLPTFYRTPNIDSSIFLYIGGKIRQGQLPFRDIYDHKPPLIFYLNALGLSLAGGSRWGVWALEWLSLSSAALLAYAFLRRYFGKAAAFIAVSAMLLNLAFVIERGNLTEEYALPFQFAALYLLARVDTLPAAGARSFGRGATFFALGVMLGMASTLKQPLAGVGLSIAVYLTFFFLVRRSPQRPDGRGWLSAAALIALGGAVVWLIWFAYFAAVGIFPEFWEAAFQYNFALSGISTQRKI